MTIIQKIIKCFQKFTIYYTQHAKREMENEELGQILDAEVYQAICKGEIIQEYPDDKPYPSVLIFGQTNNKRPLHIVCSYNNDEDIAIIITVYEPNPNRWIDFKRRRIK